MPEESVVATDSGNADSEKVDLAPDGDQQAQQQQQPQQASIISRKLKKILDSELDSDPEIAEALSELSTFFPENTLRTRRFLRGDVERRSLQINWDFLDELTVVKDSVEDVCRLVEDIAKNGKKMQEQLEQTKARTRDLIKKTNELRSEGTELALEEKLVNEFLEKYQLTDEELNTLKEKNTAKANQGINEDFFQVLDRVRNIHSECKELLKCEQQKTALEIMDQMSALLEGALERLCRWSQSQCRNIESSDKSAAVVSKAISYLQDRPVMLRIVMDEYISSRRALLVRAFIDALTVGGPYGTPKPIELHAHDPQRYIGDMLAWLHQSTPSEQENLKILLKSCDKIDKNEMTENALTGITDDVCRPLKSRVEQILLLESDSVVLYKLTNLIRFYTSTMKQAIPSSSALIQTLTDLDTLAYKQFISVLHTTVQQQNTRAQPPRHDLAPTPSTIALLSLLREILSGSSVIDQQQTELEEIVSSVLDPLLESSQKLSESFPTSDRDVFMLNTLYQIHSTLALFHFNESRLASLQSDMQLHLDTLSSEQTSNLIANLGLQPICTMVAESINGKGVLSKLPGMDSESLRQFCAKFDNFLVAPDMFLLPQTRLLISSSHRKNINRRSMEVVAASYNQLYNAVMDPKNSYENPVSLMPKNPEQVKHLLHL